MRYIHFALHFHFLLIKRNFRQRRRGEMAISTLSLPKPSFLPSFRNPQSQKPPTFVPRATSSPPSTSLPCQTQHDPQQPHTYSRRRLFEVGIIGVLALPLLTASEAQATRIEYYATVGEKRCDMNFAKSGLQFCDVTIGTGAQPPRGKLINSSGRPVRKGKGEPNLQLAAAAATEKRRRRRLRQSSVRPSGRGRGRGRARALKP